MNLDGKIVLITGASAGIGAACAAAFRKRGAHLSLTARSEEKLFEAGGSGALITAGDLTREEVRRAIVERTVERFGGIDVLINNAGAGLYSPAHRASMPAARAMWDLNYFVPLDLIQRAVPYMRKQKSGMIVNISSIAGKITLPWFTVYSNSKYALTSLSEGLRIELRAEGIHVMAVHPGYVKTEFQRNVLSGKPPELIGRSKQWAITAEKCAEDIVRGVERDVRTVVTPRSGWALIALHRLLPWLSDGQLEKIYRGQEAPG